MAKIGDGEAKYTYNGKELDDTNLYYFGARYYDAEVGRFISEDPAKDGLNWYGYCNNNPLKFVDPTGLETKIPTSLYGWVDTAVNIATYKVQETIKSYNTVKDLFTKGQNGVKLNLEVKYELVTYKPIENKIKIDLFEGKLLGVKIKLGGEIKIDTIKNAVDVIKTGVKDVENQVNTASRQYEQKLEKVYKVNL